MEVLDSSIQNVLKKKALGYYYSEESCEYEKVKTKDVFYCPKRKRVYKNGNFVHFSGEKFSKMQFCKNVKLNGKLRLLVPSVR